jgi:hypothetical protein
VANHRLQVQHLLCYWYIMITLPLGCINLSCLHWGHADSCPQPMDATARQAVIAVAVSKGVAELGVPKHDQAGEMSAGVDQVAQGARAHVPESVPAM